MMQAVIGAAERALDEAAAVQPGALTDREHDAAETLSIGHVEQRPHLQPFGAEAAMQGDVVAVRIAEALPGARDAVGRRDDRSGVRLEGDRLGELPMPLPGRRHAIVIAENRPAVRRQEPHAVVVGFAEVAVVRPRRHAKD